MLVRWRGHSTVGEAAERTERTGPAVQISLSSRRLHDPLRKRQRYKRRLLFFKFTCLGSKGDCQLLCTLTVVVFSALVKLELDADLCFMPVFLSQLQELSWNA